MAVVGTGTGCVDERLEARDLAAVDQYSIGIDALLAERFLKLVAERYIQSRGHCALPAEVNNLDIPTEILVQHFPYTQNILRISCPDAETTTQLHTLLQRNRTEHGGFLLQLWGNQVLESDNQTGQ